MIAFPFSGEAIASTSVDGAWSEVSETSRSLRKEKVDGQQEVFQANLSTIRAILANAPAEGSSLKASKALAPAALTLPLPDRSFRTYDFVETAIMAPALAAKFPGLKTYIGTSAKHPRESVRLTLTPTGVDAQILGTSEGAIYIDPVGTASPDHFLSYRRTAATPPEAHWHCGQGQTAPEPPRLPPVDKSRPSGKTAAPKAATTTPAARPTSGTQLRTYRTAVAATGEYTTFHGGTVAAGQAAIVTAMNRVTGIYETELSIRFQLIGNNDQLIYTNPDTDPFTNDDARILIGESQSEIDSTIGSANYDIGHTFSTGAGGVAELNSVGINGIKASGVTGIDLPVGDSFWVDYVAHEIGHQFGGNHTFNGDSGGCSGANRAGACAYEPGSGSTIQAYASICGNDNIQNASDPHFHAKSLDEMTDHVELRIPTVGTRTATGNTPPTVDAGPTYTIPARTPFALTAIGEDADGHPVTYSWEQYDLGPQQDVSAGDNGSSPILRTFVPTPNPTRTFPRLTDLLNNTTVIGETLPTTTRDLNFRVTIRDNQAGGGAIGRDDTLLNVIDTGTPFRVTAPNTATTWSGSLQTITWDVAGTTASGINAATVDITLSTDGGLTYPAALATDVPNDGTHTITVPPGTESTTARIRIQGHDNIFFDISDSNFAIENANGFSLTATPASREICIPGTATYQIAAPAFTGIVTPAITGLPTGATATFAPSTFTAPGETATLTLEIPASANAGTSEPAITGTSPGTTGGATPILLQLFDAPPAQASLATPQDQATSIPANTTLTWSPAARATTYQLEISEADPTFTGSLLLPTGAATTATLPLPPTTEIHWRILATNPCGTTTSPARTFTTAAPFTLSQACSDPALAIPDDNSAGVSDQIQAPGSGTIQDLDISLQIDHSWVGDLIISLTHDTTGTTAILLSRLDDGSCFGENFDIILDDEAPTTAESSCRNELPAFPQGNSYRPQEALTIFDNLDTATTWTLTVSDNAGQDTGTLVRWCFLPTIAPTTSPYQAWLTANFTQAQLADPAISGPTADPDGDGRDNLAEYTFACAPLQPDLPHGATPEFIQTPQGTTQAIRYQLSAARYDATIFPQASPDLQTWADLPRNIIATEGPLLTIETPLPEATTPRRFIRLGIELPE